MLVYDLLGGEPLLHPDLVALIRYMKARGQQRNIVVLITNGFLLTPQKVAALNDAGLDMMQISVDSIVPTSVFAQGPENGPPKAAYAGTRGTLQCEGAIGADGANVSAV